MQSFLLKTVCCILVINVTFCSSCFRSVCKARCYFRHKGFDFGYCEKGICKCAPPVIYVFDGIGRDLSDEYIDNSLNNNNVIQNSIPVRMTSASDASDEYKKNKQKKNGAGNLKSNISPILNGDPNRQPPQGTTPSTQPQIPQTPPTPKTAPIIPKTALIPKIAPIPKTAPTPQISPSPQTTPKTANKLTESSPRNIVPKTVPPYSIAGANPNVQQNHPNSNKQQSKLKTKETPSQEDNKKDEEILLEVSDESYEDDVDSNEQSDEKIKQNSPVKPDTSKLPVPVKNEKLDDVSSSDSGSGSYYDDSSEEDNANKVVNAVPKSNK